MDKKIFAIVLVITVFILMITAGIAIAGISNSVYARHFHMGGVDGGEGGHVACTDCHRPDGVADPPTALKGRPANMGGPKHECVDCHDGVKAVKLPLPEGYTSCADCHI